MSGLNKIEAPSLAPQYGSNVKQVFEQIDQNFNVLANRELYKGDAGKDLIAVNIPWNDVFVSTGENSWTQIITVVVGGVTYYVSNFAGFVESALGTLSSESDDVSAAINGLKESGSVTVCFEDKETDLENPATVLSSIPFVFVDLRFRNTTAFSNLANKTDMSCVITCTGVWACTQNFPTLYYGVDDNDEGNLYWKINGQNTSILASGPKGQDGSTGEVYIGLTNDMKLSYNNDQSGTLQGDVENINITYLLTDISSDSDDYNNLSVESQSHFPFITIADWITIAHHEPINGAPIIIMAEDSASMEYDSNHNLGVPYYISNIYYVSNSATSTVSKYNICYAHMNDNTVKNAIMTNTLELPGSGDTPGVDEIPGYSIKRRASNSTAGYSIFVPNGGIMTISYVSNINNPSINTLTAANSKFRIAGAVIEGKASSVVGDFAHAEGNNTTASGNYSHVEGAGSIAESNYSHAEGHYTTATGNDGAHAEGYHTNADGKGAHAEGCAEDQDSLIITDGDGAHAEGYASYDGEISATGNGAHAEGYTQGGSIIAHGNGAHAEGNDTTANGVGAHAEGVRAVAQGNGAHAEGIGAVARDTSAHAEGRNTIANGDGAHAEGCVNNQDSSIEANNHGAHAEGYVDAEQGLSVQIVASGLGSHAEGYATDESINALGDGSHAEGSGTTALGDNSHAEGYKTTAGALVVNKNNETFYKGCKIFRNSNVPDTNASAVQTRLDYVLTCCIELPQAATVSNISISGTSCNVVGFKTLLGVNVDEISDLIYNETWTLTGISLISTSSYSGTNYVKIQLTTNNSNLYNAWQTLCNHINTGEKYYICFSSITINGTSYIGGPQYTSFASSERDSHTEGSYTCADGEGAHAEGSGDFNSPIIAYGEGAHAEGNAWDGSILAHGSGAHAEGYADDDGDVIAYGAGAHAEGNDTIAKGTGAHAEGYHTIADGQGSHACGLYNAPGYVIQYLTTNQVALSKTWTGSAAEKQISRIIFSIGCGTGSGESGEYRRKNALIVTYGGNVYRLYNNVSGPNGRTYYDSSHPTFCDTYSLLESDI